MSERYWLLVEVGPGTWATPEQRLRRALKALLRQHGIKARRVLSGTWKLVPPSEEP